MGAASFLTAHPQYDHLKEAYKAQGDDLFIPLYWLPETSRVVRKHIPDHQNWVGFESGLWKKIDEAKKDEILKEIGVLLEEMEGSKLNETWIRMRDWRSIQIQLSLMSGYLDGTEAFLDLAYKDQLLRPAFKWIIDKRPANFDTKHVGSTFASGELATFYPFLIQHLVDTPKQQRLECYARLLAEIAKTKKK